jgi:hypothetical protein
MPDAVDGDFSRSRAVLIGTWEYRHLPPVPAAEHSLNRMTALLQSPLCGSWPDDRISVIANRETVGNLPHELVTLFNAATDVALFYYVGHGQYNNEDRLCLALTHSSDHAVFRTTTSLTFDAVRQAFRTSEAATKIAILDCCFAGLAVDRNGTLAGPSVQAMPRSAGFYLMMASGEFSTAWCETVTDEPRPQTYFTKYLADVIEHGIPGQPAGLTLGPIFDTAADALVRDGKPEPGCQVSDRAARYVLARNAAPPETHSTHDDHLAQLNAQFTGTQQNARRAVKTVHTAVTSAPLTGTITTPTRWQAIRRGPRLALIGAATSAILLVVALVWALWPTQGGAGDISSTPPESNGKPAAPPRTAREIGALSGHTSIIAGMEFSGDGRILATASADKTVRLWDVANQKELSQLATGIAHGVTLSPDGRTVAVAPSGRRVQFWDVASHQQIGESLRARLKTR